MARVIAERINLDLTSEIDHIDRNGLNNQRNNLRPANRSQSNMNKGLQSNNTTGYKGVCFNKKAQKYTARICINKERIHLGYFDTAIEAAYTYDQHYREFAVLNFPESE